MQQKMTSVSVEAQFAQKLAANEPVIRNRAVKKIRKWFSARSEPFTEAEMMRLWKGLYYCFWMSDKPLVQEELAENISAFITCFQSKQSSMVFIQSFLQTFGREWFGIDRWRVDKFMMFTRRFLRSTFKFVSQSEWSPETLTELMEIFRDSLIICHQSKANIGFKLHVTDVFLEELAKVAQEKLSPDSLDTVLEPFLTAVKTAEEDRYREHIVERVFRHLLRQSDPGIKWQDEEFEDSDEEECDDEEVDDAMEGDGEETADMEEDAEDEGVELGDDPRAGRVHSVIPQLSVNYMKLSEKMLELGSEEGLKKTCRDALYELSKHYKDVANDVFPLGPNLEDMDDDIEKLKVTKTAKKIIREEDAYQKKNKIEKSKYKKSLKQGNKENESIQANGNTEETEEGDNQENGSDDDAGSDGEKEEAKGEKLSSKERQKARKREQKKRRRETLLKEKKEQDAALQKQNVEKEAQDKISKTLIDDDIERKKVEEIRTKKKKGTGVLAEKEEKLQEKVETCDKLEKKKKKKDKAKKKEKIIQEDETLKVSPAPEKADETVIKKEKKKKKLVKEDVTEEAASTAPAKSEETLKVQPAPEKADETVIKKEKKKKKLLKEGITEEAASTIPEKSEETVKAKKKKLKRAADEEAEKSIETSPPKKQKTEAVDEVMKKPSFAVTEALDNAKEKKKRKKLKKALYRIDSDIAFNAPSLSQTNLAQEKKVEPIPTANPAKDSTESQAAISKVKTPKSDKKKKEKKQEADVPAVAIALTNGTAAAAAEPTEVTKSKSPKSEKKKMKKMKKYNAETSLMVNHDEAPIIHTPPSTLDFSAEVTSSPALKKVKTPKKDEDKVLGASPKNAKLFTEDNSWSDDLKPGETEIFIPNKSYKGEVKMKGGDSETIPGSPSAMVTPAKSFTATFLKKAMSKSEKKALKKEKISTPTIKNLTMSEPRKKKVNVVLTKNQAQNFSEHLQNVKNSPQTPHDPNKKAVKSALKKTPGGSEVPKSLNPVNLNTQLNARSKAAKLLSGKSQRKRAMDFF